MKPLVLRHVDREVVQATRALGAGTSLLFTLNGSQGELDLQLLNTASHCDGGLWLDTAAGPLWLSDASAVLGLLGDLPALVTGTTEPWYWEVLGEHLTQPLARILAPLSPRTRPLPTHSLVHCRLRLSHESRELYALLSGPACTIIRLLSASGWRSGRVPVHSKLRPNLPLELGQLNLSYGQVASLRVGDVLLPPLCTFNTEGRGNLRVAGRRWWAQAHEHAGRLFLTLTQEEDAHHG